jgi:hypothetical protein
MTGPETNSLNEMLDEFKKAIMRHRNIELLLRAARRETKIGGMERTIYFATQDAIKALEKYEAAAWVEVGRISVLYTNLVGSVVAAEIGESVKQELSEESQRKITGVTVQRPVVKRTRKTTTAPVKEEQPVAKRQYNRKNGTK